MFGVGVIRPPQMTDDVIQKINSMLRTGQSNDRLGKTQLTELSEGLTKFRLHVNHLFTHGKSLNTNESPTMFSLKERPSKILDKTGVLVEVPSTIVIMPKTK